MANIQRDPKTGQIVDMATGERYDDVTGRSDTYFDSTLFVGIAQVAGTKKYLFRDLSSKDLLHTNLTQTKKIPENSTMSMNTIGVHVMQANGNVVTGFDNIVKTVHSQVLVFKLASREVVKGPLFKYPSGFGLGGQTTENARSVVTIGPPTPAAVPPLAQTQPLSDKTELNVTIEGNAADWISTTNFASATSYVQPTLTADLVVQVHFGGLIEAPTNQ